MANPITAETITGTIGELLVQLRLLQYGVQAAPPLKDSGNDLIAVRGEAFRAIQVKTTTTGRFSRSDLPEIYHILAIVHLIVKDQNLLLDSSSVFLIRKHNVEGMSPNVANLGEFGLTQELVDALFDEH